MPDEARLWWEKSARDFQAYAQIPVSVPTLQDMMLYWLDCADEARGLMEKLGY